MKKIKAIAKNSAKIQETNILKYKHFQKHKFCFLEMDEQQNMGSWLRHHTRETWVKQA